MFHKKKLIYIFLIPLLVIISVLFIIYNVTSRRIKHEISDTTVFDNEYVTVKKLYTIDRLAVSYNLKGNVFATEDHYIFKNKDNSTFVELGHFNKANPTNLEKIKDFIARLKITRDIRKNFGANNCAVLKSGTILIFYDKIYRSSDGGKTFQSVYNFETHKLFQPFDHGVAVDKNDDVYLGEYNCNKRPHQIRILKGSGDGLKWTVFHRFLPGKIFHIHSVKYDTYRDVLWICSGDLNNESKLMFIDTDRKSIRVLGEGDQGWRIVSLITTEDSLFWCSDNDETGSDIYRYDFKFKKRLLVKHIGYPSYYSTRLADGTLVFSTAVEPDSVYTRENRPEFNTEIWFSQTGEKWFKGLSLPGEIYQTPVGSSRPTIVLPSGDYTDTELKITPILGKDADFFLESYRIIWKN